MRLGEHVSTALPRLHSRTCAFAPARCIIRYIIDSHQFEPFILNLHFTFKKKGPRSTPPQLLRSYSREIALSPQRGAHFCMSSKGLSFCHFYKSFILPLKNGVRIACLRGTSEATFEKWGSRLGAVDISVYHQKSSGCAIYTKSSFYL